jgi:ABC-type Mn2+/Zn2+ transport system ATPase subunit
MAHRMAGGRMKMKGKIEFNGGPLKDIRHSYVIQQDILLRTLIPLPRTDFSRLNRPRNTQVPISLKLANLGRYSAALRLAQSTRKQRSDLVEQVILQLALKDAANTLIGDDFRRGCSGGEKRRASIGVQLLANPSVLFLGMFLKY